jgi:hypothetical protein
MKTSLGILFGSLMAKIMITATNHRKLVLPLSSLIASMPKSLLLKTESQNY